MRLGVDAQHIAPEPAKAVRQRFRARAVPELGRDNDAYALSALERRFTHAAGLRSWGAARRRAKRIAASAPSTLRRISSSSKTCREVAPMRSRSDVSLAR